jgi:hypothetical protein
MSWCLIKQMGSFTLPYCNNNYRVYMKRSIPWEASSCSASQEISQSFMDMTVHYLVHKSRRWSLSWARWIQSTPRSPLSLRYSFIFARTLPSLYSNIYYIYIYSKCVAVLQSARQYALKDFKPQCLWGEVGRVGTQSVYLALACTGRQCMRGCDLSGQIEEGPVFRLCRYEQHRI